MKRALALLAPAVLMAVPLPGAGRASASLVPAGAMQARHAVPGAGSDVWDELVDSFRSEPQAQVRIERRVIVRISPRMPLQNEAAGSTAPKSSRRFEERRMGKCVPVKAIGSVQISLQDRLLLFMRDQRIVSVRLEKSCNVRDFYSGFYVESSEDGMICAGRDTLHSRAGVTCDVAKLHRLVPQKD